MFVVADIELPTRVVLVDAVAAATGAGAVLLRAGLAGVDVLTEYTAQMLDDSDALNEEDCAVEVSGTAVLPVLEARLQHRLDSAQAPALWSFHVVTSRRDCLATAALRRPYWTGIW